MVKIFFRPNSPFSVHVRISQNRVQEKDHTRKEGGFWGESKLCKAVVRNSPIVTCYNRKKYKIRDIYIKMFIPATIGESGRSGERIAK